jgi:hypothetical protein
MMVSPAPKDAFPGTDTLAPFVGAGEFLTCSGIKRAAFANLLVVIIDGSVEEPSTFVQIQDCQEQAVET